MTAACWSACGGSSACRPISPRRSPPEPSAGWFTEYKAYSFTVAPARPLLDVKSMLPTIEVIIPTLCDTKRGPLLLRAIDSVVSQDGVLGLPVVVVNGSRFD